MRAYFKFVVAISLLASTLAYAQLENTFKTLIFTQTGRGLQEGRLILNADMNFYTEAADFIGTNKPVDFKSTQYWLVAGDIVAAYGIIEHLDASLSLRIYQDTHRSNVYNLPDDIFLTLRAGNFKTSQDHLIHGFLLSTRFPTAEQHNYLFTNFTSGAIEYGAMYALSIYSNTFMPEYHFNAHFNIGYWNHNESGITYTFENGKEFTAEENSSELRMALATVFPTRIFDYRLELTGMLYLNRPGDFIYSAEEWLFFTPSIRTKITSNIAFDLGVQFRLSPGEREWTRSDIPNPSNRLNMPNNYPDWTVHMGAVFAFNVKKTAINNVKAYEQAKARERVDEFEMILEEREKAKAVQKEIEKLKKLRKEADEQIKEFKKILED
ncbi:MAG TPA: hypothetical protein EYP36_01245 [Calditrichaeota bacterium]|nr:hypothetical protein [Calditrichota bacterium]